MMHFAPDDAESKDRRWLSGNKAFAVQQGKHLLSVGRKYSLSVFHDTSAASLNDTVQESTHVCSDIHPHTQILHWPGVLLDNIS